MKILILGAGGQLGRQLCTSLPGNIVGLTRADTDITSPAQLRAAFEQHHPTLVVNAAGFTQVDRAESEPPAALAVNAGAVRELAVLCGERDCTLVHLSTNYVFGADESRTSPYHEADAPGPINVYGKTKLLGEEHVRGLCPRHFILRTCGLYGKQAASSSRVNFVETILQKAQAGTPIRVVSDQVCTPTSVADLARAIAQLLDSHAFGLYHVTSGGACGWHEFAAAILEMSGLAVAAEPIRSDDLKLPARRPRYSVLSNDRWQKAGFTPLPPWRDALADYLATRR